jgi:hypothetical protein
MSNDHACTYIKVTGVGCNSPALRGEQFCYFHQNAHRGVRRPPQSRPHPIAMIEDEESTQYALMEVINALMRNTIDIKRATGALGACGGKRSLRDPGFAFAGRTNASVATRVGTARNIQDRYGADNPEVTGSV